MFVHLLLFCLGLLLVILGADWLVNGASKLAQRLRVSELVIGLVIVAFGTSMPELVVSASASLKGANDIAIANVVGSNIFNLLLILGVAGLIFPMTVNKSIIKVDAPYSLLGAVVLLLMGFLIPFNSTNYTISWWEGLIMLTIFAAYMIYVMRMAMQNRQETDVTNEPMPNLWTSIGFILLGLGGLIYGGNLLVDNAIFLAEEWGMSEKLIGMTIVAMGTSLPELATSVTAAIRKKNDIAIANVIGSNIFNLLFILPICSLISPLTYSPRFNMDIAFLMLGTIVFWLFTARTKLQGRACSAILLLMYITFTVYMIMQG